MYSRGAGFEYRENIEEITKDFKINSNNALTMNKFMYFNEKLETSVAGGSGEDSDDEWTLVENKCSICKKRFSSKWHLKQHNRIHSERSGTYKCGICKKSFKRKDLREKHKCVEKLNISVGSYFNADSTEDASFHSNDESLEDVQTRPRRRTSIINSTLV